MHLFCFGFGFTARALAARVLERGWRVSGTVRDAADSAGSPAGVDLMIFDGETPIADTGARLAGVTHLLCSIPPDAAGDPVLRCHAGDLAAMAGDLDWAGYLSTTGVYGDHGGGLVDETTPPAPSAARSRARAAAEAGWQALYDADRFPLHIFRLAGIYGPGRNALRQLRAGRARRVVKPGHVFSRIHVADAARVLDASMARSAPGAIYNVCDDEAAPPQDVIAFAAALLGVDPPPEIAIEEAGLSPMAASFYNDSKRVNNTRIKRDLGVDLHYPSYREGLRALLADEAGQ